jgi:hypothetical protein
VKDYGDRHPEYFEQEATEKEMDLRFLCFLLFNAFGFIRLRPEAALRDMVTHRGSDRKLRAGRCPRG